MTTPELLPCPFCGGQAGLFDNKSNPRKSIMCLSKDCWIRPVTQVYYQAESAIEAWNSRHDSAADPIGERKEELREVLGGVSDLMRGESDLAGEDKMKLTCDKCKGDKSDWFCCQDCEMSEAYDKGYKYGALVKEVEIKSAVKAERERVLGEVLERYKRLHGDKFCESLKRILEGLK